MNLDAKHQNPLLDSINEKVIRCSLCPRLGNYITRVGKVKTKRFLGQDYWAKPLPSFGDVKGKLLIIGLPRLHMEEIGQVDYLLVIVLETGSPERCSRQDLQISLTVNPKMMDFC